MRTWVYCSACDRWTCLCGLVASPVADVRCDACRALLARVEQDLWELIPTLYAATRSLSSARTLVQATPERAVERIDWAIETIDSSVDILRRGRDQGFDQHSGHRPALGSPGGG